MNKALDHSQLMLDRGLYIGSSDAQDIINGNYDYLFRLKTGKVTKDDLDDNFKVQLGKHTEPFHLEWTIRRLNEENNAAFEASLLTKDGDQHWSTFSPDDSFNTPVLGSHPDALLRDMAKNVYPMEVKHTGRFRSADEAADFYMPQLQHHMLCWGVDQLMFSVIVGTEEPERIWIGASEEYQKYYLERCDTFWGYLKSDLPPPSMTYETKQAKVPSEVTNTIPFNGMKKRDVTGNNQIAALLPEYVTTKKAAKRHEEVKSDLKAMMADDESALFCDGFRMERNKRGAILFKEVDEEKFGDVGA